MRKRTWEGQVQNQLRIKEICPWACRLGDDIIGGDIIVAEKGKVALLTSSGFGIIIFSAVRSSILTASWYEDDG